MNNKERREKIQELIESGQLITNGGAIASANGRHPLGIFIDKKDDGIWLSTTDGLPLFKADKLYKFCQEKAKEEWLKEIDLVLEAGGFLSPTESVLKTTLVDG